MTYIKLKKNDTYIFHFHTNYNHSFHSIPIITTKPNFSSTEKKMSIGDDFSFPKLLNATTINGLSIPTHSSIWRISSLVYPDNNDDVDDDAEERRSEAPRKHKSFSEFETGDSEMRMDLLWQDFNERELKRVASMDGRVRMTTVRNPNFFSGGETLEPPRGLKKIRVSETALVRAKKRTSTVVFLRALRRLFFVRKFARESKNV